jgi:PIN domain nuclease of toxin-antitoxin system
MDGSGVIVLDTSALIQWLDGSPNLSPAARKAIDDADRRLISSISIWEIALKTKQGRLLMRLSVDQLVSKLQEAVGVEIVSVDARTWLDSIRLEWDHRDPADRVIVALARQYDCPLVTSDRIVESYYPRTVW